MKNFYLNIFIAGFFICALIGIVTLLIFQNVLVSGMCMISASILYSSSLSSLKE